MSINYRKTKGVHSICTLSQIGHEIRNLNTNWRNKKIVITKSQTFGHFVTPICGEVTHFVVDITKFCCKVASICGRVLSYSRRP